MQLEKSKLEIFSSQRLRQILNDIKRNSEVARRELKLTKKQLNRKFENTINNVMFLLLMGLFIFVTYNDIIRLIKG